MGYDEFYQLVFASVLFPVGLVMTVRGIVNENVVQLCLGFAFLLYGVLTWLPWVYRNYFV